MEQEGKAPTTIKRTNAVLRSVMKYACRVRIIHENPCGADWIRLPKIKADTDLHIDFKNRTVSITKAITKTKDGQFVKDTKTVAGNREIMLPTQCFEVLKEWKLKQMELAFSMGKSWKGETGKDFDKNYIFIQLENGSRMDVDTPTHKFKKAIENYNSACTKEEDKLPLIHLHEFRHTSATLLLANNVDIETVSHRLGHSKPSITLDVYGHWMKETDKTASDTLENLFNKKTAI